MGIPINSINDALVSKCMASGYFDQVSSHEVKNAPGNGLIAEVWFAKIEPITASGIRATSALIIYNIRVSQNFKSQPEDEIDPQVTQAVSFLMELLSANYGLDIDQVRNIDLLGANGTPMDAEAGYVERDKVMFRAVLITVPIVVNDVWEQRR